jgi:hypothetical protein
LFSTQTSSAKRWIHLVIIPTIQSNPIQLNNWYHLPSDDSVQFEAFRFYISNLTLKHQDQIVWRFQEQAVLMDLSNSTTLKLDVEIEDKITFDSFQFGLGIDSVTNVAGVHGGDLDPTKGMYWAWQSGYINAKFNGRYSSESHPTKEFQFHLGGFLSPFNAYQKISLPACSNETLRVEWKFDTLFTSLEFLQHDRIMSPSLSAVYMSEFLASQFVCQ